MMSTTQLNAVFGALADPTRRAILARLTEEDATGGLDEAVRLAREASGERDVAVMGGANVARQFLNAGLVEEIVIHLVPVLFGGGSRPFDALAIEHTQLEPLSVVATPAATHLRYRVVGED